MMFNRIDENHNGVLSRDEIKNMFNQEVIVFGEEDVDKLILDTDIDKNGQIDINEFVDMMRSTRLAEAKKTIETLSVNLVNIVKDHEENN